MAGKNQVVLTLSGDSSNLTSAFDKVGASARTMDTDVGNASRTIGDSSGGFDRVGEAADGAEGKAQGFSDTLTGTKDLMSGVGEIAKGNLFEGFVMAGQGAADLAGGMASFLIPMGKAGLLKAFAAAQWLVNAAMSANPIGLVVVAIVALIAIFVLAWKKSETFRTIVTGALNGVLTIAKAVGRWFRETFWPWLKGVWEAVSGAVGTARKSIGNNLDGLVKWLTGIPGRIGSALSGIWNGIKSGLSAAIGWVSEKVAGLVEWASGIPGRITSKVSGMFDGIKDAFRSAINWIINKWNDLSFGIPAIDTHIPGVGKVGGFTLNTPNIPTFHTGGIMPGAPGTEGLALLQAGERITPAGRSTGGTIVIRSGGSKLDDLLLEILRKSIRVQGGNVQVVLGT
jgi:phage-related protein